MPENNWILSADIGGSHITAGMIDPRSWSVVSATVVRNEIKSQETAKTVLRDWAKTLLQAAGIHFSKTATYLGIAIPGPFDYETGISGIQHQHKYDQLYGLNVRELLAAELDLPVSSIRFTNDAAAFLCGEIMTGNHQNSKKALGITLGTGFGSSFWEEGKGAWDAELWCAPFKNGRTEEFISAAWLINTFYNRTGIRARHVKELSELAVVRAEVRDIFLEFGQNMSIFLKDLLTRTAFDTVIIGGNVAKAWPLFMNQVLADLSGLDIRESRLGEKATIVGAASLFAEQINKPLP